MARRLPSPRLRCLFPLLAFAAFGCGSARYPVTGKVTYPDGSPLEAGIVAGETTVEGKPIGVQGSVQKDGSFRWGTERPGDGAFPGSYRVVVLAQGLGDDEVARGVKPAVDGKYERYETSGITHEVPNGPSELNITVTRPKGK